MTGTPPLVSVIVPNYNYGRTLGMCLRAAQQQTYDPLEILVVDDCSTDNSLQVARSLGVRVVSTPRNSGVAFARNLGAGHARGSILVFVDSDVAMRPDAVAQAVALLSGNPRLGAVSGNYDPEPLIDDGAVERYRNFHQHHWLQAAEGLLTDFVPTAILAMPASAFVDVGPFNPALRDTEGADYGRRLARQYQILLTGAVRGRHDNDDRLGTVLRKVFTRTRLHVPFFAQRTRIGQVASTSQSGGCLAAALSALGVVVPVVAWPVGLAVPALAWLAWLSCDRGLYLAAWRYRGPRFAALVVALHYLVSLATAAGLLVGLGQWVTSASFRHLYDSAGAPAESEVAT